MRIVVGFPPSGSFAASASEGNMRPIVIAYNLVVSMIFMLTMSENPLKTVRMFAGVLI